MVYLIQNPAYTDFSDGNNHFDFYINKTDSISLPIVELSAIILKLTDLGLLLLM